MLISIPLGFVAVFVQSRLRGGCLSLHANADVKADVKADVITDGRADHAIAVAVPDAISDTVADGGYSLNE